MRNHIISFVIGLAAGTFGGLIGLGGGVIMIPLMVAFLGLTRQQAHGTSLVGIIFTGLGGAITYSLHGNVDLPAAAMIAASAVFTAGAGARFANDLPEWKLRKAFGFFLLACAALILIKPFLPAGSSHHPVYFNVVIYLLTGALAGFLSGMLGVGGGIIMIPSMVLLIGLSQHVAQGTALLVIVPVGIAGALAHHELGNVAKNCLPGLIPGVGMGVFAGGYVTGFIPETPLRLAFIAVIIFLGWRYVRTVSRAPM